MAFKFRFVILISISAVFHAASFAHEAFTLQSSEKIAVTAGQLEDLQKKATAGRVEGSDLIFSDADIKLVVITGPEDDMLSFRIQGVRDPNIITPSDAKLTVWFVNIDGDMPHDLRFAHYMGDFAAVVDTTGSVGTQKLNPHADEHAAFHAEKIVITSNEDGAYKYFCSVRGHANGGMWGNILVGVKRGARMTMPSKEAHVHSPDEDKPTPQTVPTPSHPHDMSMPTPTPGGEIHDMDEMVDMPGMDHGKMMMPMSTVSNIGDPMTRESSGTSWNPDSSPVFAKMKMSGGGMWMFMGTAFLRYTSVGSTRDVSIAGKGGRSRADAPTMFMAMYSHPAGERAQFGFRSMFSLDPVIQRGYGYPLLYQSGEIYKGQPIHDRQHPHDLVSELAVTYSYKFDNKRSLYLYAGYPGEPALGPPMYLHRVSGMNNPDAPIGHHWQDASHISFGVVTAGYSFGKVKFEASAFNGAEPTENRYNFDRPKLNSFAARLSFNPTRNLSFQISHGYVRDPETAEPEVRILRRTTASAIFNKKFDDQHNLASAFVWGQNYANGERTNSFLGECNYDFKVNAVFGRFEVVQKSGHDLLLAGPLRDRIFDVGKFSAGYIRDVVSGKTVDVGIGGMLTANFNPTSLAPIYGGTSHGGWQLFIRLRPSTLK